MKRIIRTRRLTPREAAKYNTIREQIEKELPDLIGRYRARLALRDQLKEFLRDSRREMELG